MKRLMVFVVGLVFLFTGAVFAADKPAKAAPEKKEAAAVAAPADTEKKEVKKDVKKKVAKKKAAKKAEEAKPAEEKAPAKK
jgi:hypothetical protein